MTIRRAVVAALILAVLLGLAGAPLWAAFGFAAILYVQSRQARQA